MGKNNNAFWIFPPPGANHTDKLENISGTLQVLRNAANPIFSVRSWIKPASFLLYEGFGAVCPGNVLVHDHALEFVVLLRLYIAAIDFPIFVLPTF